MIPYPIIYTDDMVSTPLTPRTDAMICDGDDYVVVPADFARQLELELAAANKRIEELQAKCIH